MAKLKLQQAGFATLLAFSLIPSVTNLSGCSSKNSEAQTENQEIEFNAYIQNGKYVENQTYIFEPYRHELKFKASTTNSQINIPDGYIHLDTETYDNIGYNIYTNVETVEATATYNPNTNVVECWQPGTPIQKVNEPSEETSYQKTYTKNK